MKRPEKKDRTNMKDYDLEKCIHVGYNEAIDDFTAFMPSEEEWAEIIPYRCTVRMNKNIRMNIAKAIHKRLA